MTLEEYIQTEPSSSGQFQRRLRIFFANLAVALGWALKRSCKGCAHRLFATARWLVPEAERFLVLHLHSHNRHRRMSNFMGDLGVLLSRMQALRIAAGFMIVLVLLASIDLVTRATATSTQPLQETPPLQLESKIASKNQRSVRTTPDTGRVSAAQSEAVPLPTRKLQADTRKRMAQQKRARPKAMPRR
jgi:hypothetical protein